MSSYSSVFISIPPSDYISIFYPLLSVCLSLIQCRQIHIPPSQPLTLFYPFPSSLSTSFSLWPTKVRSHHVFPIMLSSHPAVRRWTPGRRYKGHDLQGPFANKKKKKKTLNERSVFQHSSPVLHCRFHPSKFWLRNMATKRRCGPFFCQVAKVPNFSSTRDEKAAIKPVSVFSMCVLLTCLDESDREIQMREEVGAVKAQGCGVDTL